MTNETLTYHLNIKRYHPLKDPSASESEHRVQFADQRPTVLQALIEIYEKQDPTLSFSYNCRYARCGLCAVEVDEQPVLACVTPLKQGQTIGPLSNLPLSKDLVINRTLLETLFLREKFFRVPNIQTGQAADSPADFLQMKLHPDLETLLSCIECLCCQASCTVLAENNESLYAGPYVFVKLAQLHLDPLDSLDRKAQAAQLGIEACSACGQCVCPQGIDIYNQAIRPLLGQE